MKNVTYVTLGHAREDGDVDIIACFNLDNVLVEDRVNVLKSIHDLRRLTGCEVFERQDIPDVITLNVDINSL